jgi:hypothetical protein
MNKQDFIINKTEIYDAVQFKKLKNPEIAEKETKFGCLRLYCRQYPSSFLLQLRSLDKNGNVQYAMIPISAEEILGMADYVNNEIRK